MKPLAPHFRSSFPDLETTGFRTSAWRSGVPERNAPLKVLHRTLLHAFAEAGKRSEDVGITLWPASDREAEQHQPYRGLFHDARSVAEGLRRMGVKRGDRVLIVLPTSFDFVTAFFGALMVGAIAVPAYPPSGLRLEMAVDRLCHIGNHSRVRACVTNRTIRPFLGELVARVPTLRELAVSEELADLPHLDPKLIQVRSADSAFIQYTSGSTGNPKGVELSHRALVSNIHAIGLAARVQHTDVTVSWLPLYHDMGLIGTLLFSIYWRLPLVLMEPQTFLARPIRWLRAIHAKKGTLSPAPNFAYGLCVNRIKPADREGLDLSSWRVAFNGAEPVSYRTVRQFLETYEPLGFRPSSMLPVYGLAESSLAVTFPELGRPPHAELFDRHALANGRVKVSSGKTSLAVVSVGKPLPGHDVAAVDERGLEVEPGRVGHVVVRGPSLMKGYFEDPKASAAVLVDGWLWTGDLGFFLEDELFITGRAKDMIIQRGRNYYAEDLERAAERVQGVRPGGAVAFGLHDEETSRELAILVIESRIAEEPRQQELVKLVADTVLEMCEVRIDEVVIVPPRTIPKTSSGKKQRSLCRELYLKDLLRGPASTRLQVAVIYARSRAGFMIAGARKLFSRRAPE